MSLSHTFWLSVETSQECETPLTSQYQTLFLSFGLFIYPSFCFFCLFCLFSFFVFFILLVFLSCLGITLIKCLKSQEPLFVSKFESGGQWLTYSLTHWPRSGMGKGIYGGQSWSLSSCINDTYIWVNYFLTELHNEPVDPSCHKVLMIAILFLKVNSTAFYILQLYILERSICLCFRANIDLYQMRLAVFVGSSGLGGRTPGRQTQASTLCKTHRNTKNTKIKITRKHKYKIIK